MPTHLQPDLFTHLHIDLNSFFASVEQQLHEEYRGKPLAVVPTMADTTCCIAASYEAKAFGVKTGTQVGEAKKLCPGIILIAGDHADYAKQHNSARLIQPERETGERLSAYHHIRCEKSDVHDDNNAYHEQ